MAKKKKRSMISQVASGLVIALVVVVACFAFLTIYDKVDRIENNTKPAAERDMIEYMSN